MPRPSHFQQAKSEINTFFENQSTSIFTPGDMANILFQGHQYWKLPESFTVSKFTEQTAKHLPLKEISVEFPHRTYTRYMWKEASKYPLYLSFAKGSYFTHQTALFLHHLIDAEPSTIYLNFEQGKKPHLKNVNLVQERIDFAFRNPQRMTNNIAPYEKDKIFLLNGQNTNRTGIERLNTRYGELDVTTLERTLIDIVVRPDYTNGVNQILAAYKCAKDKISIEKMLNVLTCMNFIYPYHQAIGFLLEKAGLTDPAQLKPFKDRGLLFDFYLTRQMEDPDYSKEWRLYYPKGLV